MTSYPINVGSYPKSYLEYNDRVRVKNQITSQDYNTKESPKRKIEEK